MLFNALAIFVKEHWFMGRHAIMVDIMYSLSLCRGCDIRLMSKFTSLLSCQQKERRNRNKQTNRVAIRAHVGESFGKSLG